MKPLIHRILKPFIVLLLCVLAHPAGAQDTLFVHMKGLDTLFTELKQGPEIVYVKNKPVKGPALRTNLLWLGVGAPNLGFEMPLGDHWSLGVDGGLQAWDRFFWNDGQTPPRRWRHFAVVPEVRWYSRQTGSGFFTGLSLVYAHYNIGNVKMPFGLYKPLRSDYRQGNIHGAGLAVGYAWNLGPRWRIEASAGAAAGPYHNETYYVDSHCRNCAIGREDGFGVVPKLGVTLVYTFGKREQQAPVEQVVWHPVDTVKPIVFKPVLPLVEEWKGVAGQLEKNNPVLRPSSEYRPYTPEMILRKMPGVLYVHFPVGKAAIDPAFSDNGATLDKILDLTRQILADTTSAVSCIQIVGLASVEGNAAKNKQISDARARALGQYIKERLDVDESLFELAAGGEAWTEFRDQVNDLRQSGDASLTPAELDRVLAVLDAEPDPARREQQLRSLDGGRIFARLRDLLDDQRNSGYIRIYYDYVPDSTALQINTAIAALRAGRAADALRLLEAVKDDPRAQDALGVALWETGRRGEAVSVLRASAASGDAAASRNLQQMEKILKTENNYKQSNN